MKKHHNPMLPVIAANIKRLGTHKDFSRFKDIIEAKGDIRISTLCTMAQELNVSVEDLIKPPPPKE